VRIPLINARRGVFRPTQMGYLLSIKIVGDGGDADEK
jgi:hypothetical protein